MLVPLFCMVLSTFVMTALQIMGMRHRPRRHHFNPKAIEDNSKYVGFKNAAAICLGLSTLKYRVLLHL